MVELAAFLIVLIIGVPLMIGVGSIILVGVVAIGIKLHEEYLKAMVSLKRVFWVSS